MTTATAFLTTTDLTKENYCVFGLATCFLKQEGQREEVRKEFPYRLDPHPRHLK
jgi:hypothetical protein